MKTFLCAVLTTSDIYACKRSLSSIPDHADTIVVCNTLDDDYYYELANSSIADTYPIIRTPSIGTPGRGKQSVVDYFLTTDYDYLITIDGDDFLYPEGYDILTTYVNNHRVDVIGLMNEDVLMDTGLFTNWRNFNFSGLTSALNIDDPIKMEQYFEDIFSLISQENCIFNRIICVSRKAANHIKWNEELPGTEDVLQSAKLKLLHIKGELIYRLLDCPDIYLYNKRTHQGTGADLLLSDPDYCRKIFFENFTDQELTKLNNSMLPFSAIASQKTDFSRIKYAKKKVRQ